MPEKNSAEDHLWRVREICTSLPNVTERLSHGAPTFFVNGRVFAMFLNNHHNDGRIAIWIPAEAGLQAALIKSAPRKYFRPPYVGVKGWVGVDLRQISEDDIASHLAQAWEMIAAKSAKPVPRAHRAT